MSVKAISFIIHSSFILWSWREWLKSQSGRGQMKCCPPPGEREREEPSSKKCSYFVYPAYSTRKICVATDADGIFKTIHRTDTGVFSTLQELCAGPVLHSQSFLPKLFSTFLSWYFGNYIWCTWTGQCELKVTNVGTVNKLQLCLCHHRSCRCVTKQAGWNLPQLSASCLHLFYGLCFSPTSNCVCWSVIARYWTHSSVYTPYLHGDRHPHYVGEITGHSFQAKVPEHRNVTFLAACYDIKTTVISRLFVYHLWI